MDIMMLARMKAMAAEAKPDCEEGTVILTNNQKFPSVPLKSEQKDIGYTVLPEIVSAEGNPGEISVSDKQVNGFKLGYTGSASSVVVKYIVMGGLI